MPERALCPIGGRSAPRPCGASASRAARAQAVAVDGHHVVEVQPHPDHAVGASALEGRHDHRQRADQMRRQRHHQLALAQRLAHQAEVEVLQIAQTAVHELARAARGPRGEVRALEQRHAVTARGGIERDTGAGDAAADDDDVELLLRQRRKRLAALDHEPSLAEVTLRSGRARR